jgi:valyl-tRNA synthetase
MTELAGKYNSMKIKEARQKIIEELKAEKMLVKEEDVEHAVNVHERCGTEIEFIKSKQWFVKYLDLKKEMLGWGSKLRWHPEHMKHRYSNWVKGLQWDWLISRQRYFGVPFPVWYCKKCREVTIADEPQLPVDPMEDKPKKKCKCGSSEFIPEKDVLDTWFTSSMTPRLAVELMDKKTREKLFPMDLRPQAHEIITFWLFNTVVKSNLHYKKNPFKDVMISGFVTLRGEKMSKSKGNIVEPQEIVEKYGADTLRFWAAGSKLGEDLDYQEKDIITGKKFIIKLLNAARFVFTNLQDYKGEKPKRLEKSDELFLEKLNSLVKVATESFESFEYSRAKAETEKFFWHDFCDNYLEIVKERIYNAKGDKKISAQYTLYKSLLAVLKLIAPIMPFIAEEIYHEYFKKIEKEKSIHLSKWPDCKKEKETPELDLFFNLLAKIRQAKSKAQKSMKAEVVLTLSKKDKQQLKELLEDFRAVTNAKEIKEGSFSITFL